MREDTPETLEPVRRQRRVDGRRSTDDPVIPGSPRRSAGLPRPSLALPTNKPPRGPRWVHELKVDGYRSNDTSFHRQGYDWRRYRRIEWDVRPISKLEPATDIRNPVPGISAAF
jgi:bifunctional non-homologous end joining protein LigD